QQPKAPTIQDIEQKYSQLPPQYRQAVLEKQQREHQQLLLQQKQQGHSPSQPPPPQQQQQPHQQTLRPEPGRHQSVSLSSSPNNGAKASNNNSSWSATRQRIASAPLTNAYRNHRDNVSLNSVSSNTAGPGRAHWKPDSSTNVCTWPGCRLEFGLFDRRHHCRKCGDIFCSTHCSKEIPLDQALDFNPSKGVMSRACVGCFEAYEQWQGLISSGSNSSNFTSQGVHSSTSNPSTAENPSLNTSTTTRSATHKPNTGYLPDGYLGGDSTKEGIGREDIVRQANPATSNIAIKRQPSIDQTVMPMPSVPHDWSWSQQQQQQPNTAALHAEHVKAAEGLDKFLQGRPAPEELVEKNILKDPKLAPSLQSQAEELKKAQLEDTLNNKLEHRPPVSELVEHNIIHEPNVAPSLQKHAEELKRSQLEDTLEHKIGQRPPPSELIEHHILHESNVYPEHQRQEEEQKRQQLEKDLNAKLENRPSPGTLLDKHILV
ncbi:hypothetical protein BGZ46_007351, partial [Entomortierella lignicola]